MSSPKILVVDDSRAVRSKVSRILKQADYEVAEASDGLEALQKLNDEHPVLMILDVKMPNLDGYEVCERLHQLDDEHSPRIVFLTSLDSRALEMLGDEFGAYLKKPVDPSQLLDIVKEQIDSCY